MATLSKTISSTVNKYKYLQGLIQKEKLDINGEKGAQISSQKDCNYDYNYRVPNIYTLYLLLFSYYSNLCCNYNSKSGIVFTGGFILGCP